MTKTPFNRFVIHKLLVRYTNFKILPKLNRTKIILLDVELFAVTFFLILSSGCGMETLCECNKRFIKA